MLCFALLPRMVSIWLFGAALIFSGTIEFLRIRRPEINAWFIAKFGGIHRESEILKPSGIFWTLLGCWLTMVIFLDRVIVVTAVGFLVFGDTFAALGGRWWGKRPMPGNPTKTVEGSVSFAVVSLLWALLFVKPHGALLGAIVAAWAESAQLKWNDNMCIPLAGAAAISLSLGGRFVPPPIEKYLFIRIVPFCVVFFSLLYVLKRRYEHVEQA